MPTILPDSVHKRSNDREPRTNCGSPLGVGIYEIFVREEPLRMQADETSRLAHATNLRAALYMLYSQNLERGLQASLKKITCG